MAVLVVSEHALDPLDPGLDLGDPGVDPGEMGLAAADAPGHQANLLPVVALGNHHGAAAVTLKQ